MLGKADDLGSSYNPDAALANAALEAYAYDPEGLTMEEYADLGLNVDQAYALSRVLTAGKDFKPGDGIITPEARDSFLSAGLSETFIVNLGGDNGRRSLQERIKWLSDNAFTKWYRNDYDPEERAAFLEELCKAISDPNKATDLLIKVLDEEGNPLDGTVFNVRAAAVWTLGEMGKDGHHSEKINIALKMALDDEDESVREEAIHALGKHGPSAVSILIDTLDHPDLQYAILDTLIELGAEAAPALSKTTGILISSDDSFKRMQAAQAIGNIGDEASASVPDLVIALDDEDPFVRMESMKAILKIAQANPDEYEKLFGTDTLSAIDKLAFSDEDYSTTDYAEAAIEVIQNRECLSLNAFLGSYPVQYLHHHAG